MSTMTKKDRVKAAMEFRPVDHVPMVLVDGGLWTLNYAGGISIKDLFSMPDNGAKMIYDSYKAMGNDVVCGNACAFFLAPVGAGCKAVYNKPVMPIEIMPLVNSLKDPFPKLDKSKIRENLLNNELVCQMMKATANIRKMVGDDEYVNCINAGPFTIAGLILGVQNFMVALIKKPPFLEELFDFSVALSIEYGKLMAESGANMMLIADPTSSGDMISMKMYNQFAYPLFEKAFKEYDKRFEKIILHICGNSKQRLPVVKDLGLDGYSLDSVDLTEAFELSENKLAIMGNLNTSRVMMEKTPAEIEKITAELIAVKGTSGGFMLAPGCDLPANVELENLQAITRASLANANPDF